jgi:comEA protein
MLQKLNQTLGFTPTEGRVVVFLVLSFAVGFGIKMVRDTSISQPMFNYAAADSEFSARSRLAVVDSSMNIEDEVSGVRQTSSSPDKRRITDIIDINTATKQELISLPGIGEAMAERIIHYREDNGKFTSLDDLMKIKGIGKKKLAQITPYCTVEQ